MPSTELSIIAGGETAAGAQARSGVGVAYWTLRIGAGLCYIGHGAFGLNTKAAWLPYFAVARIPASSAWRLMPWIGALDVAIGLSVLIAPRAGPLLYMTLWAAWTALRRPLSGQGVLEAVERAGNFGVPLAMWCLAASPQVFRGLLRPVGVPSVGARAVAVTARVLRWSIVMLLFAHGALGVAGKALLSDHYVAISMAPLVTGAISWFEIAASLAITAPLALAALLQSWDVHGACDRRRPPSVRDLSD